MKVLTSLLFGFFAVIAFGAQAQGSSANESYDMVMYDPLFWKDELRIRTDQSRKLEKINTEFYQNIRENRSDDRQANTATLERGLQERSKKIYETLLPKQRRKLEKIIDQNAPYSAP